MDALVVAKKAQEGSRRLRKALDDLLLKISRDGGG